MRIRIARNFRRQRSAATVSDSALDHFAKKGSQRQTNSSSGALRIRKQPRVDYHVDASALRWHMREFYRTNGDRADPLQDPPGPGRQYASRPGLFE
jgi:hypothetical protein